MSGGHSYHPPLPSPTAHAAPNSSFPPASYSPTQRSRPYYANDAYLPPQTPPQYPAHPPVNQSPRFAQSQPSMNPTMSTVNGATSRNTDPSPQYQSTTSSPGYARQAPYTSQYGPPPSPSYLSAPGGHAHPTARQDPVPLSPTRERHSISILNGDPYDNYAARSATSATSRPVSQEKPAPARANPMSFANILSEPAAPSAAPKVSSPVPEKTQIDSPALEEPPPDPVKSEIGQDEKMEVDTIEAAPAPITKAIVEPTPALEPVDGAAKTNGHISKAQEPRRSLTEREKAKVDEALAIIETADFSDAEDNDPQELLKDYNHQREKRMLELDSVELGKRKRRRVDFLDTFKNAFAAKVVAGSERFRDAYEAAAQADVHNKEIQDEKERKKDMQRKRRREQTIRNELQKKKEAEAKAEKAEDAAERDRLQREAERHGKKIKTTERALQRGTAPNEISEVIPLAPNLEGGTTSTFQLGATESPEPVAKPKRKAGGSTRLKKSKEQKQQEKDKAEAAFAAMDKEEPVKIAPKEEPRKEVIKKEAKASRSKEVTPASPASPYDSKGYTQIYEQIWRDMARKDIPKVFRIKAVSLSTRQENMRKTAQLASKQARKWQERTNKSMKDTQARAKRTMREMMTFWKRNEREERDLRRMAEKKEIEDAKRAEAEREANRQKRKLNFLISQTELYSHFIGRKIKTDEVERSTDDADVAASGEKIQPGDANAHTINLPSSVANVNRKVTNIEDLDFDAEDETALQEAAMANAQSAIQEAQDKARAFNDSENKMAQFDDGELNFQNPTSFGDVQVAQPKMLQAQLKDYQLKGLNWLVNLYEQGINGILADEMGLGKTVQSISVMGYLAEYHNIWGPFLVIAPASTLHNWQQEITKFVPTLKVLPYWGNAKDRKILRKFWDRKHVTYSQDSEFHVLVTSYQLVVQDAQYFQKIRWQYMILDEAQAIKSSSSSRWKALLGFHCRNRLLLTGTPIQNNMQELWALLHFIMPTLFDSHDEFSDWFSKDIESHAQSNTKLNQDQLKRLHMILKPFMLRRVKAHVQKELGDKVEKDIYCDLTYRQRAYYSNLRSKISIMDLIERATMGDDQDTATLMNLVMQFRKVCNHPDLFERAEVTAPLAFSHFAETASFVREGQNVQVAYSIRNLIEYDLPRMLCSDSGRLNVAGPGNSRAGFEQKYLDNMMNIWTPEHMLSSTKQQGPLSFLRFMRESVGEVCRTARKGTFERALALKADRTANGGHPLVSIDDAGTEKDVGPLHALFEVIAKKPGFREVDRDSPLYDLCNVSRQAIQEEGLDLLEPARRPGASAPPIQISCFNQDSIVEREQTMFNVGLRQTLYPMPTPVEEALFNENIDPKSYPPTDLLPTPANQKTRYTTLTVPSMRRFVTDSGKLAQLDKLLRELKSGGHRVLLYFQMTRMIDLMEEYLTYRSYKYCRLDGSTKLEDRRDTVHDFQTRPEIFIFLLSTRAGGLGINLTSADTVIFYDSDWNPTIDSQAMDRAHRLGQTKQVTVYRMITRGTIEERIRKRALQKEEVQRVVISGGAAGGVDFNTRIRENRTKDIALWLADDDQAALIEQKEKEAAERPPEEETKKRSKKIAAPGAAKRKRGEMSMDDLYHEGEGHFGGDDSSNKPSGEATPVETTDVNAKKAGARGGKGTSKKAKTREQRLQMIDGDMGMGL